jgi:hypothetical protein
MLSLLFSQVDRIIEQKGPGRQVTFGMFCEMVEKWEKVNADGSKSNCSDLSCSNNPD